MLTSALLETRWAGTQDIPPKQRLAFWKDYNASALADLRCSSYSQANFVATQDNLCLERLWLAHIGGSEYVVEHDRSMTRVVPKESIPVPLVRGSQSFFYQDSGCNLLQSDEPAIYQTDKPYLFGSSRPMWQFIFDIPQDDFAERCLRDSKGLLKIGVESPVQRLLVWTLGERTRNSLDSPHGEDVERYQEGAYDPLASIINDHASEHRVSTPGVSYLLAAKQYIQQHLDEPALSCERAAAVIGVPSQHLARLFVQEGSSSGRYLQGRRLEWARRLFASPQGRRLDVAEVAYRHDFSSQAHFARAFKAHYGMTPSEARSRQTRLPYLFFSYCQGPVP